MITIESCYFKAGHDDCKYPDVMLQSSNIETLILRGYCYNSSSGWDVCQLSKHDGAGVGGKSVRCGDDVVVPSRTCWPVGHSSAQTLIELTGDSVG